MNIVNQDIINKIYFQIWVIKMKDINRNYLNNFVSIDEKLYYTKGLGHTIVGWKYLGCYDFKRYKIYNFIDEKYV